MMIDALLAETRILLRARDRPGPPGPPPPGREHLVWNEQTSRWVLPPEQGSTAPRRRRADPSSPRPYAARDLVQAGSVRVDAAPTTGTVGQWEVPVHHPFQTDQEAKDAGAEMGPRDIAACVAQVAHMLRHHEHRRDFMTALTEHPVSVHEAAEWDQIRSRAFGKEGGTVMGFYSGRPDLAGVHCPVDVNDYTLLHELGHQLAHSIRDQDAVNMVRDLYADVEMGRKEPVTAYAAENHEEYFAEIFAQYLTFPELVEAVDPEAYAKVKRHLLR